MNPPPCDCGKDGFTYNGARRVIKQMTWTARRKGRTVRTQTVYKCPQGNGWHLTSNSYKIPNPKKEAA